MSSVCVHGLGYIGLPTAAMLANYDHDVYGYDTNDAVVEQLHRGSVHLDEPGLRAFVTQALESEQLEIIDSVVEAKYHMVCVPTPFDDEAKRADLSYVQQATEAIAPRLRVGDTVILESTVPPGTTTEILRPILEASGLTAGEDFALVHCPETVLPGNIITELQQNNRIIGGVNGVSTEAAVRLYDSFVEGEIRTTKNATTAEFVKLVQNTYRDTNIALANEIARLANDYGVDSREAIDLANEHPRVDLLQPGPGVGGHCLPIDPWFLGQNSDELDLIKTARAVNDGMSGYVIELLCEELETLSDRKIAVLGVAYKGNVGDARESPGLKIVRELRQPEMEVAATDGGHQAIPEVSVHDPHVVDAPVDLVSFDAAVDDADAVVFATDHDEFEELDLESLGSKMKGQTVVDTKGLFHRTARQLSGLSVIQI